MTVKWNGQKVTAGIRKAIMRGILIVANEIRNDAIDSIAEGDKSGRIYRRRGVVHQASAPGEPPATDTGNLINSIEVEANIARLAAVVSVKAEYGAYLEYGTQKMEARPYMRPALAKNIDDLERTIALEVKQYLGK